MVDAPTILRVRIIKCKHKFSSWYREEIGNTYEVVDYTTDHYLLLGSLTTPVKLLVEKEDVEIVG